MTNTYIEIALAIVLTVLVAIAVWTLTLEPPQPRGESVTREWSAAVLIPVAWKLDRVTLL